MYMSAPGKPRRPKRTDALAGGSERMLKAHHKNAVFLKSLEDRKDGYDVTCRKRLSKVQHEICDVYFNEYIPLREQVNELRGRLPSIGHERESPRWKKLATVSGGSAARIKLPEIHTLHRVSSAGKHVSGDSNHRTELFLDLLRQQEGARSDNQGANMTSHPAWEDDSDADDCRNIDEDQLRIIKAAIALTSQPAVSPEPVKAKLMSKSFLFNLRRQSKIEWENELLSRAGTAASDINSRQSSAGLQTNPHTHGSQQLNQPWLPCIAKNKIFNDSSDDESYEEEEFTFPDRLSSPLLLPRLRGSQAGQPRRCEPEVCNIDEDLHAEESSPDMFSGLSDTDDDDLVSSVDRNSL